MGGRIDRNIYTQYKGQRVYFCCAGCEERFLSSPETYVSKLPQFAK
jgi:Cu(I)/Ag(I) efflux system membrane fusion protein